MTLNWEDAMHDDEPGDTQASSLGVVAHGYWQCGPDADGSWGLTLIEQDETLDELRSWEWRARSEAEAQRIAGMLEAAGITADEISVWADAQEARDRLGE
jgi:hypothetical protein